jgi:hypothetical protein
MSLTVIQTWKSLDIPQHMYNLIMKMRSHNPNVNNFFFTDKEIDIFVNQHFPCYYDTFSNFKYNIQKVDFFRYLAIYYYGGLYLDLDMDITASFDTLDRTKCIFPVETKGVEKDDILLGNYAFYAPPKHPFLLHIINLIVDPVITDDEIASAQSKHTDPKEHVYVYFTTGPELVTRAYWSYPDRENIMLLEPSGEYQKDCFGNYGRHCSFGSWKSGEPTVPPETPSLK